MWILVGILVFIILFLALCVTGQIKVTVEEDNCEHKWQVVHSYLDTWGNGYNVISRCEKCGKLKKDSI